MDQKPQEGLGRRYRSCIMFENLVTGIYSWLPSSLILYKKIELSVSWFLQMKNVKTENNNTVYIIGLKSKR